MTKKRITDRMRMNWLAKSQQLNFGDSVWVRFSPESPDTRHIRYAIDAAIRAERRRKG